MTTEARDLIELALSGDYPWGERQLWPDLVRSSADRLVLVDGTTIELTPSRGEIKGLWSVDENPDMTEDRFAALMNRVTAMAVREGFVPLAVRPPIPPRGLAALGCGMVSAGMDREWVNR